MRTLLRTQARLFLREPANVFFGFVFPALVLGALGGLLPTMRQVLDEAAGLRVIDVYVPVVLALAVATVALTTFPPTFATYREKGILRRLSTTPLPASRLLVAEVVVNLAVLVAGVALALVVAFVLVGAPAPAQPLVVAGAFILAVVQMLSVGGLIAAVAPTAGAATVASMTLYFPMLFFAGVWLPAGLMPDVLARVASVVPLGAAAQALTEGWYGEGVPALQLVVMATWTAVLVPTAAKVFRWT